MIPYGLGLPIWAFPGWKGRLFTRGARSADLLGEYSQAFNTVEGNTTFYQLPSPATVERWRTQTAPGFRFALKFPRSVTHDRALRGAALDEARAFLQLTAPLGDRRGPYLLQLPPTFAPAQLDDLDRLLAGIEGATVAVEVRHVGFWRAPGYAQLNDLLAARGAERAIMDTRSLRATPPPDEPSRQAWQRKPDLPIHPVRIGAQPFIRIVNNLDPQVARPFLAQWAEVIAGWLAEGCHPWIFIHTPGEHWAPEVARTLHEGVRALRPGVEPLPAWPGEREGTQLGLL